MAAANAAVTVTVASAKWECTYMTNIADMTNMKPLDIIHMDKGIYILFDILFDIFCRLIIRIAYYIAYIYI